MELLNESQEDEKSAQITFDARQLRAKLLVNWLNNLATSSANNNYNDWYYSLRTLHYLCSPYVNKNESEAVKVQLAKTKNVLVLYTTKRNVSQLLVDNSFGNATDIVLSTYRDQFMMTHKEESVDFEAQSFDGGVD